jgi:hypothetical protein
MDALVWGISALSEGTEQEIVLEHTELRTITPELDEFEGPDFRQF